MAVEISPAMILLLIAIFFGLWLLFADFVSDILRGLN